MAIKVLIIVDVQNDFILGSLWMHEGQVIIPKVCEKIKEIKVMIWKAMLKN